MSASDKRMREITVQGAPDLQEIHRYYMQKLQSLEDELASIKAGEAESGSCVCAPMASNLWSTLPNELLQQIFARLPPAKIIRLQCLSKTWKWNLTSRGSEFKRACAEAGPRMFAMVSESCGNMLRLVQLYDIKASRWHSYEHKVFWQNDMMYAGDGGLVCVVSFDTRLRVTPLITVFNPLDLGRSRVLPHEALQDLELEMVQLVMNRGKRCYKVLVVGREKDGGVVAKIFSSETGAWNGEIFGGLIFGHQNTFDVFGFETGRVGPCAYDCVGRQLLELDDGSHPCFARSNVLFGNGDVSSVCYALVKDHLFVLHDEATGSRGNIYRNCRRYCISEYRGQKRKPHWVKLRTHRCKEFERPPSSVSYAMSLFACEGFLLVRAENGEDKAYHHVLTWLYDMATGKWQAIPPFADRGNEPSLDSMFELQWDAIP